MPDRRPFDNSPRAFISYARSDGEEVARTLRERLERGEPELTLWQDRTDMGPADWWRQITEALDRVPFMVLVLTPASVQSRVVWKEWRYARQRGVCVVLVKGSPELDFGALPRWMRKIHCYELDREWQTFVRFLKSPPRAIRIPFMAPDLPEGFVERVHQFSRLRALLLDADRHEPVAITTALRGAGGLGKTTLATALCHDEEIQAAFDDGILWVTSGQDVNLFDALAKLFTALTGQSPPVRDVDYVSSELAKLLEDKTCLIVLDDVWDPAHLRPFRRGGKGSCAWLITTRQLEVAVDAQRVDVDTMSPDESVALLTGRLGTAPVELGPFRDLARRLGGWPLLLELAGSALRLRMARGDTLERALDYTNRALDKKGLGAFDRANAAERHQSMIGTIDISVELLEPDERRHFLELAIFPEDSDVPHSAVEALCGLDDFAAEEFVQRMADLSLLKLDLEAGTIRLHDVMRAYLAEQLTEQLIDPTALHVRLIDAWGDPHRLPDSYAWHRYAYHMEGAGRRERLRALLLDPGWLLAKLEATDPNALLADFEEFVEDTNLQPVKDAIRLSAHILTRDKSQFRSQMFGRLFAVQVPSIRQLLSQIGMTDVAPWLRPLTAGLTPPGGALHRTLAGHTDWVRAVAVMPDGRHVISASDDQTLKIWDLDSGAELRSLSGHAGPVRAVAVTPDGRHAISASDDQTLKVWDLDSGAELRSLSGHTWSVRSVAITPDGRHAVSASNDQTLKVWDLDSGAELRSLVGHADWVNAVTVMPDGHHAVSASEDRSLKVWDLDSGAELRSMSGHTGSVRAVAATPEGSQVISASDDQTLKVWDLVSGVEQRSCSGHSGPVRAVAVTPDGRQVISSSDDQTLKVWDLVSGAVQRSLSGHADWVHALTVTPDGRHVVSGSDDRSLKVWNLDFRAELRSLSGHAGPVHAVAITPDGRHAVSASDDHTLKIWNLEYGAELHSLAAHAGSVRAVAVTPDGRHVVSASVDRSLKVWDLVSGAELQFLAGHSDCVNAVAMTPDGRHAVSASYDRTLKVWDLDTGAELHTLSGHSHWVHAVAVTPDGHRAVSASYDGTLKVWDLGSGAKLRSLVGHLRSVRAVAVTSDGHRVVSASDDRTIKVWELDSGAKLRSLGGHTAWVRAMAVTPDGCRVVSASDDQTLKVWDLGSGTELRSLAGHANWVRAVAVTSDGRRAVSASNDHTLKIWDLNSGHNIASFSGDAGVLSIAVGPDGSTIVAGDVLGRVHFLRLEET